MADRETSFEISADVSKFQSALRSAAAALNSFASDSKSALGSLTGAFEGLQGAFIGLGAVLGGGALFAEAVSETKRFSEESINLGKSLGISASEASGYALAIGNVGGNTDDFANASRGLTRQLKTHEAALNDMGIKTRDAGGNLRDMNDLMTDAIAVVNSYTEGTDRNLAAQVAFGKGASASSAIFRLTKEDMEQAKKSAIELGLVVGKQNVADFEENRKATAEAGNVFKGLEKAIGDALLPVLTQLAEWFREIGPTAIAILRTAMANLVTVFWTLDVAVQTVWDLILAMVASVIEPLKGLGLAIYDALHGNFSKAGEDVKRIATDVKDAWQTSFQDIDDAAAKAAAKIKQAFADPTGDAAAAPKGKDFNLAKKDDDGADDKVKIKSDRWLRLLLADNEREIAELKRKDEEEAQISRDRALGDIADKELSLKEQLKLGEISAGSFLQQENELIAKRLAVEENYLQHKKLMEQAAGNDTLLIDDQIVKAEAAASKQRLEAQKAYTAQIMRPWESMFSSIQSGFARSLNAMMTGAQTFGQGLRSMFRSVTGAIADAFANMVASNITNLIKQAVFTHDLNLKEILAHAYKAAAGAYDATVGIPYVGPVLAPIAAAAAFTAVTAFGDSIPSASQGYVVPAGVNPMTQLHENEMVLPAHIAKPLGESIEKGGSGGGKLQIEFIPVGSDHGLVRMKDLADAIKRAHSRFAFAT